MSRLLWIVWGVATVLTFVAAAAVLATALYALAIFSLIREVSR